MTAFEPLAARLRPQQLSEVYGQAHLLDAGKPLWKAIQNHYLHSLILWGTPGTGKTTLANLLAKLWQAHFISLSAVNAGIKEVREAIKEAQDKRKFENQPTILFIDEVHRFNKTQQDAFLPYIEDGTLIFMGATTENPSFALNNALLSRVRVYALEPLTTENILCIIERACLHTVAELKLTTLDFPLKLREQLALLTDGDARRALNIFAQIVAHAEINDHSLSVTDETLKMVLTAEPRRFDKNGDSFYEQISALHKSVRGSSPDGALYWLARMLDGGCDPIYIARRLVRMASEDIGNADPRALELALTAWETQQRLGSPEGELALAQAAVYLASAPKSNAVYVAFKAAVLDVKNSGSLNVPIHLRNAATQFNRNMGYGQAYRYDHDEPQAFSAGQTYFPPELGEKIYYQPVERGLEIKIAEKLQRLRQLSKIIEEA